MLECSDEPRKLLKVNTLLEEIEWPKTTLGDKRSWPPCLHRTLELLVPSPAPIVIFWGPSLVTLYNDSFSNLIGHLHPRAFGRPFKPRWGRSWNRLAPLLRSVMENGSSRKTEDLELKIDRNGYIETAYFETSISPIKDDSGFIFGVLCIVSETTPKVVSARTLRANEEQLQGIFAQTVAGIAVTTDRGKFLSVNQRFCEIVGRSEQDLLNMQMQDITHPDDLERNIDMFRKMISGHGNFEIEKRYCRPDGSFVWVSNAVSAIHNDFGDIAQAVAIVLDISDRRERQAAEKQLASIISSSNDAILGIDLNLTVTSWNRAAEALYGYSEEEILGESVLTLVPTDRLHEEPKLISQIQAGKIVEPYETKRLRKDGEEVAVLLSVSPIYDARGNITGASKISQDISARKESEHLQKVLINELQHRVKNVLATVVAIARQTLGRDKNNADEVEAFTNRLMSLGRAHDLLVHGNWSNTDLRSVISEIASPYPESAFKLSGGPVKLHPSAVIYFILAFHELATNSTKYGALSVTGGYIEVNWYLDRRTRNLRLTWKEKNGPQVSTPSRRGFGSTLIERLLTAQLNGHAEIHYETDGVRCEINASLAEN